ncbi:MATE family efflux transporter [Pedobacter sp.]|uniref:MATE family efflux transporter n=1 Tax=Pedobacter sp. TaxID=1411316 RepID=UPI003D7FC51F
MESANKVAFNTVVLYIRMIITVVLSLYTTRLVLSALGATDYGIFNLIAGIVSMLSFLNAAMTASTQRYLSFYQGRNDLFQQKKVFSNSLFIHVLIGIIVVFGLEVSGMFLFDGFLKIPVDRVNAAKYIFHFMSVTVFFTIIAVPFTASLNARENMMWTAIVNILESVLKFGIAILLLEINRDKLEVYGLLTAAISIVSFILYAWFCLKKYQECRRPGLNEFDVKLFKELTSFAGWNLFGALAGIGRTQGLAIILNLFFGAVVNAAYGIANQVAGQLNFFSATLLKALNPQIMRSEGANDRQRMLRLSMIGSKFCFFLLAIIAIPCIFEMENILRFWLTQVPEFTVIFCKLVLIALLTNQLTIGLQSAFQATGKIKLYQTLVGITLLLNLPLAYLLLKFHFPAYSVLRSYIFIEAIACFLRILLLKKLAGLSVKVFFNRVLARELLPVMISCLICVYITQVSTFELQYRFLVTCIFSTAVFSISVYFLGLCNDERLLINKLFINVLNKMK